MERLDVSNSSETIKNNSLKYLPRWPPVNIEFQDLSYSVPDPSGNKVILRGISGKFLSGQLTAILGGSGAGKSTLLNVLAGFKTSDASANVFINGRPRNMKTFRKMSRYIMQTDLHQPHLTVLEAMMVSADLKLGKDLTKLQKNEVIDEILDLLRLTKTRETMCQQLSGGEKKRLSIALELVNNPPVIFLDEPTTGLDDLSCSQCMSLLRRIALGGRTVVCSIHTPSAKIFQMFDHVYVMAVVEVTCGEYGIEYIDAMVSAVENGKCYRWTPFSGIQNVVDESGGDEDQVSPEFEEEIDSKQMKCRSTSWDQFKVLFNRRWKQMWRDSFYMKLKICLILGISVLVGCLYQGCGDNAIETMSNFRLLIAVSFSYTYIHLMPVLLQFPSEVALLRREHFNKWFKLPAYYWALVLGKIPILIGLCLLSSAITYTMSGQLLEWKRIFMFFTIVIMIAMISESMGLLIASRLSLVNGMFIGPVTTVIIYLGAVYGVGCGKEFEISSYMKILRSFSYLRHGVEGLVEAVYGYDRADIPCPDTEIFCIFSNVNYVKSLLGFHHSSYFVSIIALWCHYLLYTIAAYYMIKMRLSISASNYVAVRYIERFAKTHLNFVTYKY